ncbi:MAG: hypothetical protein INH41_22700 [Myxococcaceae bacterium]|jgi:hypothetical protein|nr:hypothetical protein [Myxococcaceae bacterium]MCA3015208.1 hypothetical protein [Myxococcaceae bacterium]
MGHASQRWLVAAALMACASMFYLACGPMPSADAGVDGGIPSTTDAGRSADGGPQDPLCTGVVCNPGSTCRNGVCELDMPTSG